MAQSPPPSPPSPPSPPPSSPPPGLMENLAGVIDIMLGRASGKSRMDLSAGGIGWSFAGLALAGLIDISALSMLYNGQVGTSSPPVSKGFFIFGHLTVALIAYLASFIALFLLCRMPQEQKNFPAAIAIHNWVAPIVSLAFLPLLFIGFAMGGRSGPAEENTLLNLISVFWIVVLIFIGIRLIRLSLELQTGKAIVFFVVTTAVSLVTKEGLESLIGLTAQP
ncbi:MAG: hypothetical protein ABJM29_11540 [Rhizobiaceae bacterium]